MNEQSNTAFSVSKQMDGKSMAHQDDEDSTDAAALPSLGEQVARQVPEG